MIDLLPRLGGNGVRLRDPRNREHVHEDLSLLRSGKLDFRSFVSGFSRVRNPVELVVRDANGKIKAVRRTHNLRVTQGRDNWQRLVMFGDITANATGFTGVTGSATATSATSLTNTGAAFPTAGGVNGGLQGHVVIAGSVYGIILSNTATVLTVDQWYNMGSPSGAAGATPGATSAYVIVPNAGAALWIGLSTNATAPAAGDVLRSADGLYADGTTTGVATEQTTSGLARAFVQPTFPSASNTQLQHTWTYTGSTSVTLAKVVLCNSLAAAGSLLFLETLLSATATVSANGDSVQATWTVTL